MDEATRDRASRVTRIRERRLEWIGLGTRRSCATARVCLKKEREIQELKKDAKKFLTTAGLVRDSPSEKSRKGQKTRPLFIYMKQPPETLGTRAGAAICPVHRESLS